MKRLEHLFSHWDDYHLADMASDLSDEERNYLTRVESYLCGGDEFPVLELHYIQKKKYNEIADELGYAERNIYRIRTKEIMRLHNMLTGAWRYMNE
ncbi:MAG: sigma-70 family RNA polymerase sigma factor [Lachnospiraceae bacterium]|nr:sigma-70 family RNA polymerase sigma factor [Lachnospiraceae bacterium]